MNIEDFQMERWQSIWENQVKYNLAESGVHPLTAADIVPLDDLEEFLTGRLGYIQTNGTPEFKRNLARYYPETDEDNFLVTSGSAEANYLLMWSLIEPGDRTAFMLPNFMQIQGLMKAFGAKASTFTLREELDWAPSTEELKKVITKKTRIIAITNPNNPTGAQLTDDARRQIIDLAEWANAWLIVDEVYQGAEREGPITPTFWGATPKTVVTCGLSKAYGLPGLRTGWIVGPKELIENTWRYKDYTTIAISALSDRMARMVMEPKKRWEILERSRRIIKENWGIFQTWMEKQKGLFYCVPPKAGAIAFPRYDLDIGSTDLAHRIREECSVLLQPGDQQGIDRHLRFGLGESKEKFETALDLVSRALTNITK